MALINHMVILLAIVMLFIPSTESGIPIGGGLCWVSGGGCNDSGCYKLGGSCGGGMYHCKCSFWRRRVQAYPQSALTKDEQILHDIENEQRIQDIENERKLRRLRANV
eukprot:396585_1